MSYLTWHKEHADAHWPTVNDGAIENLPAYQESSKNDLSDSVIGTMVQKMLDDPKMTVFHFIPLFCQYLFEEYHVSPADIEVLTQYVMYKSLSMVESTTMKAAELAVKIMQEEEEDSHEEGPDSD